MAKERDGRLAHLAHFVPAVDDNQFCGTVDSFQGGEADVVVVSLVRNNAHSTPLKALGFLCDSRRMNVLLSRAKWRMILVGSLAFYRSVLATAVKLSDEEIGFLSRLLGSLESGTKTGDVQIKPWEIVRGSTH